MYVCMSTLQIGFVKLIMKVPLNIDNQEGELLRGVQGNASLQIKAQKREDFQTIFSYSKIREK